MSIYTEEAERRSRERSKAAEETIYHRGQEIAKFAGWQGGLRGERFALYHLVRDIPGHPKGSTVSLATIEAYQREPIERMERRLFGALRAVAPELGVLALVGLGIASYALGGAESAIVFLLCIGVGYMAGRG